jgi:hypothetical protein
MSSDSGAEGWYRQATDEELRDIPLDGSMGLRTGTEGRSPRRASEQAGGRAGGGARSNGGLVGRDVDMEWVAHLPGEFRDRYEALWLRSRGQDRVKEPENQRVGARAVVRVKSSETATRPGAAPVKGQKKPSVYLDETAGAMKSMVDRKLRKLARQMAGAEAEKLRRCTGAKCRRWCDPDWIWCPWCGSATSDD